MSAPINASVIANDNRTQLLISVTTIEEAKIALESGADIIDLKEPSLGALGALPIETVQAIVTYVKNMKNAGAKLTSATIGDLPMQPELLLTHVARLATTRVDIIKIGFFHTDDYQLCLDALKSLTQTGLKLMAVFFAEITYPQSLIDYYSQEQRMVFAKAVLVHDLQLGLAGSLKRQHVALIKELNPSYIGFRGGVCENNHRELALDTEKIKAVRKVV